MKQRRRRWRVVTQSILPIPSQRPDSILSFPCKGCSCQELPRGIGGCSGDAGAFPARLLWHGMPRATLTVLVKSAAGQSSPSLGRDNKGCLTAETWQRPSRYREVIKCQVEEEGGGDYFDLGKKESKKYQGEVALCQLGARGNSLWGCLRGDFELQERDFGRAALLVTDGRATVGIAAPPCPHSGSGRASHRISASPRPA